MTYVDLAGTFSSPTVGFLLKLAAGLATTGFGILGVGATTRTSSGELTGKGKLALAGIIVGGSLAVGACIFDFVSAQNADRSNRLRAERLLKSVQRGIFPMRGAKVTLTLQLAGDIDVLNAVKRALRAAIDTDRACHASPQRFLCTGLDTATSTFRLYDIPSSSALFPAPGSDVRRLLDLIYVHVAFYTADPASPAVGQRAKFLGRFFVDWRDHGVPDTTSLRYDYANDTLSVDVRDFPVKDKEIMTTGIYSLVDFLPGYLRLTPNLRDAPQCDGAPRSALCDLKRRAAIETGMSLSEFAMSFPYPKQLRASASSTTVCKANKGNGISMGLAIGLPADVEDIDSFGQVAPREPPAPQNASCLATQADE